MTVGELKAKLEEYGEHLNVMVQYDEAIYPLENVDDEIHDNATVVVLNASR